MNQNITTSVIVNCFFCGRDLSQATIVQYVAEGPVCSICLAKINGAKQQAVEADAQKPCPCCYRSGRVKYNFCYNCGYDLRTA